MQNVVNTSEKEKRMTRKLNKTEELMLNLRDKLRNGEVLECVEDIEINCIKSTASNYLLGSI